MCVCVIMLINYRVVQKCKPLSFCYNFIRCLSICKVLSLLYSVVITPPPVGGWGFVFERFLSFFISLFISLSATLRENVWTNLHEIFRESVEWPWDDQIQFWVNSGNESAGRRSSCSLSPAIAQSQLRSLRGSRGLALTSQLHSLGGGACCAAHHSLFKNAVGIHYLTLWNANVSLCIASLLNYNSM